LLSLHPNETHQVKIFMSQQTLEILSDKQIAPSLLESKYPELIAPVGSIDSDDSIVSVGSIASVDSIDSEDLIFQEYSIDSKDLIFPEYSIDSEALIFPEGSIAPEYSIDSEDLIFQEDSITPQEIDIDSLTGIARRRGPWPGTNNGSQVTDLKDARLNIAIPSIWQLGSKRVTATVKVELDSSQRDFINSGGSLFLQSSVWGIDNTFYDRRNDLLFYFPDQKITQSGTYSFTTVVGTNQLNEDYWWFDNRDEIQASISLVNYSSASPLIVRTHTNIFTGWF
jgi:hypothetical protein